ncbi:hypothetical protein I5Q31_05575 [Serratia marcescens]|nr:hypothetical protein [Serratia marcescens]MBH2766638.1 hypothetical protein [Serratia marcescens]MBH2766698.1 hypothetical protein [Serratia marcescens]
MTEGQVVTLPSAHNSSAGQFVWGYSDTSGFSSSCVTTSPNKASLGQYWILRYGSENSNIIAGAGATPGSTHINVDLLDASNVATGWKFSIEYPSDLFPKPWPWGTTTAQWYPFSLRLSTKGSDLVPGHTYHLNPNGINYTHVALSYDINSNPHYKICGTNTDPLNVSAWYKTQADTSGATVSFFDGSTINSGLISDGTKLGIVQVSATALAGGQSASVRWSPTTWVTPGGGFDVNRYSLIKNSAGNTMRVGLDCGAYNANQSNGGQAGPSFIYSDSNTLQCTVVKGGDEGVTPGDYQMSIQAAVRTP